jgi:hypothetical protein
VVQQRVQEEPGLMWWQWVLKGDLGEKKEQHYPREWL